MYERVAHLLDRGYPGLAEYCVIHGSKSASDAYYQDGELEVPTCFSIGKECGSFESLVQAPFPPSHATYDHMLLLMSAVIIRSAFNDLCKINESFLLPLSRTRPCIGQDGFGCLDRPFRWTSRR